MARSILAVACFVAFATPILGAAETLIQVDPWTSKEGSHFLKVTLTTPGHIDFTTLKLTLETDAVVEESMTKAYSFIGTDNIYPLQAGTGVFKIGASDWAEYSVSLHQKPKGAEGFILVLASGHAHPSPAQFYVLLASKATYLKAAAHDPPQLADAEFPSGLMTTPIVNSSISPHLVEEL